MPTATPPGAPPEPPPGSPSAALPGSPPVATSGGLTDPRANVPAVATDVPGPGGAPDGGALLAPYLHQRAEDFL
ncbi:hypothetical protein ACFVIM_34485, partial [Streptomyces sp. NPDC057638]